MSARQTVGLKRKADSQGCDHVAIAGWTREELAQLVHSLAQRIGRCLERDAENSYLAGEALEAGSLDQLLVHSITYRIAVGPQAGRKVFTLQTLPAVDPAGVARACLRLSG